MRAWRPRRGDITLPHQGPRDRDVRAPRLLALHPRGLRALLEGVGLQVETIDGWGNRMCVLGNLSRWAAYRRWLPLRNEPDIPLQLWAFARNPLEPERSGVVPDKR